MKWRGKRGRSPRKPADQQHRPAQFPHAKILSDVAQRGTLASHQGEPGSIPSRVTPDVRKWVVTDDAVGRRVFSGIFRFPRPFIPALLYIHFTITLIGSQDLAVKSHPNLFTHSSPGRGVNPVRLMGGEQTNRSDTVDSCRWVWERPIVHPQHYKQTFFDEENQLTRNPNVEPKVQSVESQRNAPKITVYVGPARSVVSSVSMTFPPRQDSADRAQRGPIKIYCDNKHAWWGEKCGRSCQESRRRLSSAEVKWRGKRDIPEKTLGPVASSATIPKRENPGVTRPEVDLHSPRWEASGLTTAPPGGHQDNKAEGWALTREHAT
ncbi:hypothetical protein PR048_030305 [Dryococelus australis]|uniref:Uncharacterized protein n=1 Tax=Dryococelus australis TaxID=614101 RepID=A0ABQ9G8L9_9NEOP|nr:hypothetical protein PR048_030305 [Dryococelus australis]